MIRGDVKHFSWRWAVFEFAFLAFAWAMVWFHVWPRTALIVVGVFVAFGLLVECSRFYRRGKGWR